ncbi:MAG: hypothetical protein ABIE07_02240 [Candidatus Zixiibacteriota bacterium]
MKYDASTYMISDAGHLGKTALTLGIAGLVVSLIGYFVDNDQFFFSYLTSFAFWFTLSAGALFFAMVHHLTGATWSVVLRRLTENIMLMLPLMIIFFLPILFGAHSLYHWTHVDAVAQDALLMGKQPYLNMSFFVIRSFIYFAIWIILIFLLRKYSLRQDDGHTEKIRQKFGRVSAPGMILFALSLTFASFDWLMSLDPHWYSTIYGVYIFSGGLVGFLTFTTLILMYLRNRGVLANVVTIEHYHDLGKLTFAFMVFWGYMAFSQYFLIWYANIPEETIWFLHRWEGSWKAVSLLLVFGNFVIPFFILITRGAKRQLVSLKILAGWLLFMHYVDMYWLIIPTYHQHGFYLSWMDISTFIGIGGICFWFFWSRFVSHPIVPIRDPRLEDSINFINH